MGSFDTRLRRRSVATKDQAVGIQSTRANANRTARAT